METPRYFDLTELLASKAAVQKKIPNLPTWEQVDNLRKLGLLLDKIRVRFGKPITVSSGFRCDKLNAAVGGSKKSQHRNGEAADCEGYDNRVLFNTVKSMIESGEITVGQLIDEYNYSWVHISLPTSTLKNQILHIK